MSDRYPAEIQIGGPIPRTILVELVKEIVATGASHGDYSGGIVTQESVQETDTVSTSICIATPSVNTTGKMSISGAAKGC